MPQDAIEILIRVAIAGAITAGVMLAADRFPDEIREQKQEGELPPRVSYEADHGTSLQSLN